MAHSLAFRFTIQAVVYCFAASGRIPSSQQQRLPALVAVIPDGAGADRRALVVPVPVSRQRLICLERRRDACRDQQQRLPPGGTRCAMPDCNCTIVEDSWA